MTQRDTNLDGWRGVAITALLIGHFVPGFGTDAPWYMVNAGRLGVELFFALSGCLIGQILFVGRMPLPRYAIRRFARIVPSMWFYILAAAGLFALSGRPWEKLAIASSSGWLNFIPAIDHQVPYKEFGHLWSVCLELQGYVIIGLVASLGRCCKINAEWLLCGMVALSCVASILIRGQGWSYQETYWRPEFRLNGMLLAAALIALANRTGKMPCATKYWLPVMSAGVVCQISGLPDTIKYTLGSALIAGGTFLLSRNDGQPLKWLSHPLLLSLGTTSYSIYLWQQIWHSRTDVIAWPVALSGALLISYAMHHFVDTRLHKKIGRWMELRLLPR